MKNNIQIRLHGRGGQGTVTAAELIAVAGFYDGKKTQAFPSFGVERRGAPVMAFARISDKPIRTREQIYEPDYLIIQDPSLIVNDKSILNGINKDVYILINSEKQDWPEIKVGKVFVVPATKIALEKIGKPFINTALVGAFASLTGLISKKALEKAINEKFANKPDFIKPNIEAMNVAYEFVKNNI